MVVTAEEALPLKVGGDTLRGADNVAVHGFLLLRLAIDDLQELTKASLESANDMGLELREAVLNGNQVIAVVVLLHDLLVQSMVYTSLEDIGIFQGIDLPTNRIEVGSVLTQKLNMFLGQGSSLVHSLAALSSALGELLGLVLDLRMEALKERQDGAFERFSGVLVRVGHTLLAC